MKKTVNSKIEDILNVTSMQHWYYNIYKNAKDSKTLMMDLEFVFSGTVDLSILKKSWNLILKKYPMLRTAFYETKTHEVFQVVYKDYYIEIEAVNWKGINPHKQEKLTQNLRNEQNKKRIDLQAPPLLKLYLIQKTSNEFSLRWYFPVLLMDGWNVPILFNELISYYSAYSRGKNPGLVLESYSMKDYIVYQRDRDKSEDEIFWKNYLLPLENVAQPKKKDSHPLDYQRIDVDLSAVEDRIRERAKKIGVSLNCIFQLSYMLALARLQNRKQVFSRTTVADRPMTIKDIHNRVGLYINEIPIKLTVKDQSFEEMAKSLQDDLNLVFSHVSCSLEEISSFVGNESLLAIDNTITFENMPMEEIDYSSLPFSLSSTNFVNHPYGKVNIFIWPSKNMNIKLLYDAKTYFKENMIELGNRMKDILINL